MQWVRAIHPDGSHETGIWIQEPQSLTHGKKVPAIGAACLKHWKSLRNCGHTGVAIEHYAWDRMGFKAQEALFQQVHRRQQVMRAQEQEHEDPDATELLNLSEFVLCTPCALHDCQNAFRWSMHADFKDRALLRDVYISIASLRKSFDLLTNYLPGWIAERLTFRAPMPVEWVQERK
eukprot:8297665-Lingulodinium_polyedra.AAC.1